MNLPFFKPKPRTPLREYIYALEINHNSVKSAVWTVANGRPHVVATGKSIPWDDVAEEELISACDQTISECTSRFDPSGRVQPEKVILGLPSDWVSSEKIASSHLRKLKHVSEKLSLTAVGFVVIPEAVARYLQTTEGAPVTAILISVSSYHLEISLVKLGKIIGTQLVKRSQNIASDVVEGISRFTDLDMLPSRMLVYGTEEKLDEIRQTLLSHPWQAPQTRLPFLHFPKIENLSHDFSIQAVALAGGSEVAQAIGLTTSSDDIEEDSSPVVPPSSQHEEIEPKTSKNSHGHIPEISSVDELGFVEGQDVLQIQTIPNQASHPQVPVYDQIPEEAELVDEDDEILPQKSKKVITLPRLTFPSFSKTGPLLIGVITLLVIVGLGAAYWYLPKSTITLTLESKQLEDKFDVTADTSLSSSDNSKPAVPAVLKEVSISESSTVEATGTKIIGDRATGVISLINGTPVSKKFPAGTVISSSDNLKFTFDSDVEVASASGSADPNSYQPGKAEVKVSASVIGTASNLSAGSQFKVGSFSSLDFVAKNESAFTGGTSRQVKAVSKEDFAKLRSLVSESAKEKAKNDLLSQIDDSLFLVSESIKLSTVSEDFNHKVDDAADEVTLKQVVKAQGLVLNKSDLATLAQEKITPQIPQNYSLVGDISYDISFKSLEKNIANLTVNTRASLLPNLDTTNLSADLLGKKSQPAFEFLQSIPGVVQVDIAYWPPIPQSIRTLPRIEKNINFVVVSK